MSIVNVNLKSCDCGHRQYLAGDVGPVYCVCDRIPIPCPIPRTVEMTVRLGKCTCTTHGIVMVRERHVSTCPARTIRVTCSIRGDSWETSEVDPTHGLNPHGAAAMMVCRARWEVVKALVTGVHPDFDGGAWTGPTLPLFRQRDAVFAALAKMATKEQGACNAQQECDEAFPYSQYSKPGDPDHRAARPSVARLAAYVSHLIATVGALT